MKQSLELKDWDLAPDSVKAYIQIWKKRKGYATEPYLTYGHCVELLIGVTRNLHYEYSDGRTFNHILINNESVVAWDGHEPIDIKWYEIIQALKHNPSIQEVISWIP